MLVLMKAGATEADIDEVCGAIRDMGLTAHKIPGAMRTAIGITGNQGALDPALFARFPSVAEAVPVSRPWKLVSREVKPDDTVIKLKTAKRTSVIGGGSFGVMAGPCAVESRDQLMTAARAVAEAGATLLRGGAYKPRTSPYAFQGMKEQGLELLVEARDATGLPVITEVV